MRSGTVRYVEWLDTRPEGRPYREEIDRLLGSIGWRQVAGSSVTRRRGWFRG